MTLADTRAFFIAGTDTDAGKTTVASALLACARQRGYSTLACKPVASGSELTPQGLRNADALALAAQCSIQVPYPQLNPHAFAPAIAPHLAARDAGQELSVAGLQADVQQILDYRAQLTLVEGAGGWRVPLNTRHSLADLAIALQLPVILVVGMRLGCINHALLSAEAILRDGLPLAGWVANHIDPKMPRLQDNLDSLQTLMPAPCLAQLPPISQVSCTTAINSLAPALKLLLPFRPATEGAAIT